MTLGRKSTTGHITKQNLDTFTIICQSYSSTLQHADSSIQYTRFLKRTFVSFPGAYGTVFKARDRLTGAIVALKTMRFTLTEDGVPMAILREISLLKQLEKFDHPNIVRCVEIMLLTTTTELRSCSCCGTLAQPVEHPKGSSLEQLY